MDLAKAAATVVAHGGTIGDYVGDGRVPGPVLPLICLPTTAGTGSEVTFAAVLTDTENQLKVPILSNYIRSTVAIVDPQLTISCPPRVTADSGIDALTHAIEAYTAIVEGKTRIGGADEYAALQGIARIETRKGQFDEALKTLNRANPDKLQGVWRDNILKSVEEVRKAKTGNR